MNKLFTAGICAMFALTSVCTPAFAAALTYDTSISSDGVITVTGNGNVGKVFASVIKTDNKTGFVGIENATEADFTAVDAKDTEPNGNFTFTWHLPNVSSYGYYALVVGNTGNDTEQSDRSVVLHYASPTEINTALKAVNEASDTELDNVLKNDVLQLEQIIGSVNYEKYKSGVLKTLLAEKGDGFDDTVSLKKALKTAIGIQIFANAGSSELDNVINLYSKELGIETADYEKNSDAVKRCFASVVKDYSSKNPITSENVANLFKIAVAIANINTSSRGNLLSVIEENEDCLGVKASTLSEDCKTYIAKDLCIVAQDNEYKSLADFQNAFSTSVDNFNKSGSQGGGGTKGTGGGSPFIGNGNTNSSMTIEQNNQGTNSDNMFTDLNNAMWAKEYIECLAQNGIVSGKSGKTFAPGDYVTREEFAKMLVLAMHIELTGEANFADVDVTKWYAPYVGAAVKAGIVNGFEDNTFGIGKEITRQDAAVMIHRAVVQSGKSTETKDTGFDDNNVIAGYAVDAVKSCFALGIINGNENNKFLPLNNMTRAECAKMIYCLMRTN